MIAYIGYALVALIAWRWAYGYFAYNPGQGRDWMTPPVVLGAVVGLAWPLFLANRLVRGIGRKLHWPLLLCSQVEIDAKHAERRKRIADQEHKLDELLAPTEHCSNCGHVQCSCTDCSPRSCCPRCGDAVDASKYACPNSYCDYSPRHHCKRCGSSLGPNGCPSRVCFESRIASTMRVPSHVYAPAQPEFCKLCRSHHSYNEPCPADPKQVQERVEYYHDWAYGVLGLTQQMRDQAAEEMCETREAAARIGGVSYAFCEQHQWQQRDDRGELMCKPDHERQLLAALGPGIPVTPIQIRA